MNMCLTPVPVRDNFWCMTQLPVHQTEPPELMTVAEVAEKFRDTDETIHRWCRKGRLPYVPLPSGLKRFRRDDIEAIRQGLSPDPVRAA